MRSSAKHTSLPAKGNAAVQNADLADIAARRSPEEILAGEVSNYALFLDCDGTLLDIAPTPDEVHVPGGLADLLTRITQHLDGAVAVLTGRQLDEIDVLLEPWQLIGAGVHGAELRTKPGGPITQVAERLPVSLEEQVLRRAQHLPGIIAEPKGPGIAVHYRQAPHLKNALESELRAIITEYSDDLVLCPGRKLFEIIPAGHSKGTALETFAAMPKFAGRRPIMIGDDVGDLPAFAAAARLDGFALRVAGEHFGRDDVELNGPADVISWLERLAQRLTG